MPEIESLRATTRTIPTDAPESDGTLEWDSTTIVIVEAEGGGETGIGYTYGPEVVAGLIEGKLAPSVTGTDALTPQRAWATMRGELRNAGQAGVGALAISAVDLALHDLRARLLGVPLARAVGGFRDRAAVYGSGGFTTYGPERVAEQLGGWAAQGISRVKLKVGRDPDADPARLEAAREAVGHGVRLMTDANGAFSSPADAIAAAHAYAAYGVDWLEEPLSSDDLDGLREVRAKAPPGLSIAAGEYSWSVLDARRMLDARAVDVLQADVTRCGGLTGLLQVDAVAAAHGRPLSLHCAPAISCQVACALERFVHLEYFHDHVRIEEMLFDGRPALEDGHLVPDLSRAGNGLSLNPRR